MPQRASRTPRTKEELVNKLLSFDFDGDIRHLGDNASIVRVKPHIVRLTFPDTGGVFDLTVHIPRAEHQLAKRNAEPEDWEKELRAKPAASKTTRRAGRRQ